MFFACWLGKSGANARVLRNLQRRQVGISAIPHLGHDLLVADVSLECLLVPRPVEDQPTRTRIAYAVGENGVETPRDDVDEIAHVVLKAAVVVAGEQHAALAIDEGPPGEMYRLHPRQILLVEKIPNHEPGNPKQYDRDRPPEPTGFTEAERAELVLQSPVLDSCEFIDVLWSGTGRVSGLDLFLQI